MSHPVAPGDRLLPGPRGLDYLQVMRRIECAHADQPRLGTSSRVASDPVRIGQDPSLCFSGVELKECVRGNGSEPAKLTLASGLLGTDGPMPLHLGEYVWARAAYAGDRTWTAFLDMFNHRMACLLYRAWAVSQPVVSRDRIDEDDFSHYVGSLCGLSPRMLRQSGAIDAMGALQFCALLADRRRHAGGLGTLLSQYFKMPVVIEQFVGQWLPVPAKQRTRLSRWQATRLGQGYVIGGRVWDRQHKIRIVIGPLDFETALRLQPGSSGFQQLARWVRLYTTNLYDWDLDLQVIAATVAPMRLTAKTRLVRNSWLGRPASSKPVSMRVGVRASNDMLR